MSPCHKEQQDAAQQSKLNSSHSQEDFGIAFGGLRNAVEEDHVGQGHEDEQSHKTFVGPLAVHTLPLPFVGSRSTGSAEHVLLRTQSIHTAAAPDISCPVYEIRTTGCLLFGFVLSVVSVIVIIGGFVQEAPEGHGFVGRGIRKVHHLCVALVLAQASRTGTT